LDWVGLSWDKKWGIMVVRASDLLSSHLTL
jgi:hypothetical protein